MNDNTIVPKYKWAKTVKMLGDNKCDYCGIDSNIEAHHIQPRRLYPELANDLTNGISLCHRCHLFAHGGSYYNVYLERELGHCPYPDERALPVMEHVANTLNILVPKGQKQAIEAHAKEKDMSINGLVNELLRTELGISKEAWKG